MKQILLTLIVATLVVGCGKAPYERKKFPPIPTERETPVKTEETAKEVSPTEQSQRQTLNAEIEQAQFENPELFTPNGEIKPPLVQLQDLHPELFE